MRARSHAGSSRWTSPSSAPPPRARRCSAPFASLRTRSAARAGAAVAVGNVGTADDVPVLDAAPEHDEPLVRPHAAATSRDSRMMDPSRSRARSLDSASALACITTVAISEDDPATPTTTLSGESVSCGSPLRSTGPSPHARHAAPADVTASTAPTDLVCGSCHRNVGNRSCVGNDVTPANAAASAASSWASRLAVRERVLSRPTHEKL